MSNSGNGNGLSSDKGDEMISIRKLKIMHFDLEGSNNNGTTPLIE